MSCLLKYYKICFLYIIIIILILIPSLLCVSLPQFKPIKVVFMPQKEGRYSAKMVVSTRFVLANYIYDDNEGKVVEGKRGDMMEGGIWSKEYPANIDVIAIAEKPLITVRDTCCVLHLLYCLTFVVLVYWFIYY